MEMEEKWFSSISIFHGNGRKPQNRYRKIHGFDACKILTIFVVKSYISEADFAMIIPRKAQNCT